MTYVGNQTGDSLSLLSHVDTVWDNSLVASAVIGSNHHENLKASGIGHWEETRFPLFRESLSSLMSSERSYSHFEK